MNANGSYQNYQSMVDRMMQNFTTATFGSPIEAKIGGTFASVRASDTPAFVSKVLAEAPASVIDGYPDLINGIRTGYGLDPLDQTDIPQIKKGTIVPVLDTGIDPKTGESTANQVGNNNLSWITEYLDSWGLSIGWFVIGLTLLGMGVFLLAYNTDAGKAAIKAGAEAAAA